MFMRFFYVLALGVILSFVNFDCSYAQRYISGQGLVAAPPLKRDLGMYTSHFNRKTLKYFQKEANKAGKGKICLQSAVEFPAIQNGDTVRIRYVFDNSVIAHIEIEGVGETTPKDIQNGMFEVTVSPEKTTLYKANIHVKSADSSIVVLDGIANRRVIVIEGDRAKYAGVMSDLWFVRDGKNGPSLVAATYQYLNRFAGDVPEGMWVYSIEKFNEYLLGIAGIDSEIRLDIPDTKTILQMETANFDSLKIQPDMPIKTSLEHSVVARGDSTRIKFIFDSQQVKTIKVLGIGKASRNDIKRGEYVVTITPPKTKLFECYVTMKGGYRVDAHQRIIVVEPDKYDEVMKRIYELRAKGGGCFEYMNELAGKVRAF